MRSLGSWGTVLVELQPMHGIGGGGGAGGLGWSSSGGGLGVWPQLQSLSGSSAATPRAPNATGQSSGFAKMNERRTASTHGNNERRQPVGDGDVRRRKRRAALRLALLL